jgi:putative ABC transport system permease protein
MAVGAVVALVGIARGFEQSLRAVYEGRGIDLMVLRAGSMQRFSSVLDAGLGQKIRQLPGVQAVYPGLVDVVSFEDLNLFGVVIQGFPRDAGPLENVKLIAGRAMGPRDRRVVMLGKVLAQNLDKTVGQSFEVVPGETFQVVGIYESFNVFENGSMIMALDELQQLMGREGEVTHFMVRSDQHDQATLERLRRQIKALAPAIEAMPTRQYVDASVEIRMARSVAWLTSSIALIVGTIGMINTMLTAVFERTRELAVLRAIGWRKARVVRLILWESVLLGLAGAAVGTVVAIGLTQFLSRLPASGRMVSGEISLEVILQGLLIAVLVGVAGGLYPALRAARLLPTEGLRHE